MKHNLIDASQLELDRSLSEPAARPNMAAWRAC